MLGGIAARRWRAAKEPAEGLALVLAAAVAARTTSVDSVRSATTSLSPRYLGPTSHSKARPCCTAGRLMLPKLHQKLSERKGYQKENLRHAQIGDTGLYIRKRCHRRGRGLIC